MGIRQLFILIMLVLSLGVALGRIASKLFYRYEAKQADTKTKFIIKRPRQKQLRSKERRY